MEGKESKELSGFSLGEKKQSEISIKLTALREKPKVYQSMFEKGKITPALTFNDVLMVPQYGEIESRS